MSKRVRKDVNYTENIDDDIDDDDDDEVQYVGKSPISSSSSSKAKSLPKSKINVADDDDDEPVFCMEVKATKSSSSSSSSSSSKSKKAKGMSSFLERPSSSSSSSSAMIEQEQGPIPSYVLELAKSARAECRRCDTKIVKDQLRVGVIMEGDYGLFTRWQHLECTVFHKSVNNAQSIDGYIELRDDLKQMVIERIEKSANEIDEDRVPIDTENLVRKDWDTKMDPSPDLLMPLLPYQKEGLAWMVHQETNSCMGGILADEMGITINNLLPLLI